MAVGAAVLAPSALAQQAAPVWSQFQGDPGHAGVLADGPAPPYRERWRLPAPEGTALSGAVILGGTAMTVGSSAVYGVDLATGEVSWQVPRAGGPLSVPAVVAGVGREPDALLYLEGPESSSGAQASPSPTGIASPTPSGVSPSTSVGGGTTPVSDLVAIDAADQGEVWRTALEATARTGVTVEGDSAFVADDGGTVTAVGVADGAVRWTRGLEGDGGCPAFEGGRIDAPLVVADGRVVSVARDNEGASVAISAYDVADGACAWRVVSRLGSAVASAPVAAEGDAVIGFADRFVRRLAGSDGTQRWTSIALSFFLPVSSPALDAGAMYVVDVGGGLYRLDASTGARTWSYQFNEQVIRSSPVVSGRTVLLGLSDGRLVAVDATSGHLVWQSPRTPGLIGAIALAPDVVVAVKGGRDAGLVAFERDPDAALLDEPSPTELDPGTTLTRFGLAAAIAIVVVLLPGALARRRFGETLPAAEEDEGDGGSEEDEA